MSEPTETSRRVRPYTIVNPDCFIGMKMPDGQIVRELVQNGLEAVDGLASGGRVTLDVRDKELSATDNGCGMTPEELERYFAGAGSSGKTIGLGASNKGFGIKAIGLLRRRPVTITSRALGASEAFQIKLVCDQDPETKYPVVGAVEINGKSAFPAALPKGLSTKTVVHNFDVSPDKVLREINGRYLDLLSQAQVQVRFRHGTSGDSYRAARGALACLADVVTEVYPYQGPNYRMWWGVRRPVDKHIRELVDNEWEAPMLSLAYGGEIFRTYDGARAINTLDYFGIDEGAIRLCIVIEITTPGLEWSTARDTVPEIDPEIEAAQEHLFKSLEKGEPANLAAFLATAAAQAGAYKDGEWSGSLREMLTKLEIPTELPIDSQPDGNPKDPQLPSDKGGSTSGASKRNSASGTNTGDGSGSGNAKRRDLPEAIPVTRDELGDRPFHFNRRRGKLLFNMDWEMFSKFTRNTKGADRKEHQLLIASGLLETFANYVSYYKVLPTDEQLHMACFSTLSNRLCELKKKHRRKRRSR